MMRYLVWTAKSYSTWRLKNYMLDLEEQIRTVFEERSAVPNKFAPLYDVSDIRKKRTAVRAVPKYLSKRDGPMTLVKHAD